ncbi:MAG: apolipoprotein N-acyltransferase [Kiloniellaceae bacterium]
MRAEPAVPTGERLGLARLAGALAALTGWRRHAAAVLCGVLATAAFAPLYLVPLLVLAFAGLLWLLDGTRRPRQAFTLGWSFGFGHMATGFYWVGIAFLVDAERFGFIMPIAVVGLAAGLALFPALALLPVGWLGWRGPARVALLAGAWLAVEWLRSWVLTGFPWNLMGSVWSFSPAVIQLAAATGVWGLSLMTVLAAAAPAVLAAPGIGGPAPRRHRIFAGAMLLLPALAWAGGTVRLAAAPAPGEDVVQGVRLRLVQASIDQSQKWRGELRQEHVERQMRLSVGPGFERISHVIWPETAVPYLLNEEPDVRSFLARVVPPGGLLITGAPRGAGPAGARKVWNSLFALDGRGKVVATYDKHHLVPFGEYVPLRGLLGLDKLTPGRIDFSPGPGPVNLNLPGLPPASPLICYEAIFPGRVSPPDARPAWLLNITNDAWFGTSSGPYQHLAGARLRAVEEGLALVRVANSGVTALIDGYGRMWGRLGLNEVGVLDVPLPRPLSGLTPYARMGNWAVLLLLLGVGLYTLILRRFSP